MRYTSKLILNGTEYEFGAGGGGWQPGANTIAYYPLTSVTQGNDMKGSGTAYNLSHSTQAPTYGTNAGVDCANMTNAMLVNYNQLSLNASLGYTHNLRFYIVNNNAGGTLGGVALFTNPTQGDVGRIALTELRGRPSSSDIGFSGYLAGNLTTSVGTYTTTGVRHNGCLTYDGTTVKIYLDGVHVGNDVAYTDTQTKTTIYLSWRGYNDNSLRGYMSNVIFEDKARTATEIQNYFNQTKSLYGIS